jgi:cell division protein FtsI (penicillin-binding protein 3)
LDNKNLNIRIYIVALIIFLLAVSIVIKLTNIQWVQGAHYRELGKKHDIKVFHLPANRGNIYSADGSLLATSVPKSQSISAGNRFVKKSIIELSIN